MTDTKAHDCTEAVAWLPCPHECQKLGNRCIGDSNELEPCTRCQGTGLRFPGLSEECKNYWHRQDAAVFALIPFAAECPACQGRGRIPVDSLEAWLDAAESIGRWDFWHEAKGYHFSIEYRLIDDEPPLEGVDVGPKPTPLAAISEALCHVTQSHPVGEES